MTDPPDPPPPPAESRVIELLRLVGDQTPPVSDRFTSELVGRARRQRAIAVPLRALGGFMAALATAFAAAATAAHREPRS